MSKQLWRPGNMLYPVPAVMVSCALGDEKPNIITVAWAGTVCSSPAMVSISVRPDRYSHHIIKESGEFVVNLVTEELLKACDYCGVKSGKDMDKFAQTGLTPSDSYSVDAPGIAESPVNIECKVKEIISLGSHDMFIGEVTGVVIDDSYMNENGKFELNDAKLTVYSHGSYFGLGEELGTFGYSVAKKKKATRKNPVKAEKTAKEKTVKAEKNGKGKPVNKINNVKEKTTKGEKRGR